MTGKLLAVLTAAFVALAAPALAYPTFTGACDGVTNDSAALTAALANGQGGIEVPFTGSQCRISGTFNVPSNYEILGTGGRPIFRQINTSVSRTFDLAGTSGVKLTNIGIDLTGVSSSLGEVIWINLTSSATLTNISIANAPTNTGGAISIQNGSVNNTITDGDFTDIGSIAISVSGVSTSLNTVTGVTCTDAGSFCIRNGEAAHHNTYSFNTTNSNGKELVGLAFPSSFNTITGNFASGTGDNGISISGDNNLITNNDVRFNQFAGIGVWGSNNTISGNTCISNNQVNNQTTAVSWSGIWIEAGFGGFGQNNLVEDNSCDDQQETATQTSDVLIQDGNYPTWAQGATITTGDYRVYGLNVYYALGNGTTGSAAPTCRSTDDDARTQATCHDGGVWWRYRNTALGGPEPRAML